MRAMGRRCIGLAGQRSVRRVRMRATCQSGTNHCGPLRILPHRFAGHAGVEDKGTCGLGRRGLWAPFRAGHGKVGVRDTAGHVGLEKGCNAVFREETGQEIDWQGVVRAISRVGRHLARAIVFRPSSFAGQRLLMISSCGSKVFWRRGVRVIWSSASPSCRPSWRLGFWLAGSEPVRWCCVRTYSPCGGQGCGPARNVAYESAVHREVEHGKE
jgi:hypothetical protein